MAYCPHCNRTSFELEEVAVAGLTYKPTFIQCSQCKAPVGIVEYIDVAQQISDFEIRVAEHLRILTQILQKMSSRLDRIEETQRR
jgi:alkyl hydroperoxide reductase subunit AhpF